MLDDLRRHRSAERRVRQRLEIRQRIGLDDVEAALSSVRHHPGVRVDAARGDAMFFQQRQELTAPAADVEDVARACEHRHVHALLLANLVDRSAEPIFETPIE